MTHDWAALIAEHDHHVVLALLARGERLGRARELAHDAWSAIYEAHRAGRLPRLELPGLVIRQATFLALDGHRERRWPTLEVEALQVAAPQSSPEAAAAAREALALTGSALERCPPRAREVFSTALAHPELDHAALAQRLGLSLQRVRQTLHEVRTRLRQALRATSEERP